MIIRGILLIAREHGNGDPAASAGIRMRADLLALRRDTAKYRFVAHRGKRPGFRIGVLGIPADPWGSRGGQVGATSDNKSLCKLFDDTDHGALADVGRLHGFGLPAGGHRDPAAGSRSGSASASMTGRIARRSQRNGRVLPRGPPPGAFFSLLGRVSIHY